MPSIYLNMKMNKIFEDFTKYETEIEIDSHISSNGARIEEVVTNFWNLISPVDPLYLEFFADGVYSDPTEYKQSTINEIIQDNINFYPTKKIKFRVRKNSKILSIYHINSFFAFFNDFLKNTEIIESIKKFNELFINLQEIQVYLEGKIISNFSVDDLKIRSKFKEFCYLLCEVNYELDPRFLSFFSTLASKKNISIDHNFYTIRNLISFMCIADKTILDFKLNTIVFSINGLRSITQKFNITDSISTSISDFVFLFDWVYGNEKNSDRLKLIRNIYALHLIDNNILIYDEELKYAIEANYELVLKMESKDYIESLFKLSESMLQNYTTSMEILKDYSSRFKANIFSLFSIIFSVIIFNSLTSNVKSLFFSEIFVFSILLLLLSLCYAIKSFCDFRRRIIDFERYSKKIAGNFDKLYGQVDTNPNSLMSQINTSVKTLKTENRIILWQWLISIIIILMIFILFFVYDSAKYLFEVTLINIVKFVYKFL